MQVNAITNGDCLEELKKLPDECIDLVFADPPYWMRTSGVLKRVEGTDYDGCDDEWDNQFTSNEDYNRFTRAWLGECKRVLKPNGSFWVIGGMQCIFSIGAIMQELGFWFINDVVWHKKNPTPNFKGTRLNNAHELLIWATKDKKARYTFNYKTAKELNTDTVLQLDLDGGVRKQMGSVWRIGICQGSERLKDENGEKLHSTQKPEELLYRVVAISSKLGDVVLDPFGGTMTTAALAKKMGRNYLTIEASARYCEYGQKRLDSVTQHVGAIERADFDVKPPRVTFSEMIQAGYFSEGEELYYKQKPFFKLAKSGKIFKDSEKETDIHSSIAQIKQVKADRLNGWDYWQVLRSGSFVPIIEVRQKYINEVKLRCLT